MFNRFARLLKNRKGFTLVELMVVVVIIGILAGIAVPVYQSSTKKAEQSAVEANLRTIDGAIMQYQANNNGNTPSNITTDLVGNYLQSEPKGPGSVIYNIANNGRATATGSAGGKNLSNNTLPINW